MRLVSGAIAVLIGIAAAGPTLAAPQVLGLTAVLPRIFEPLFTTKGFGVGLGLPTVRQIVEKHGGTIDVSSPDTGGTTVTVWLPRHGDAQPQATDATGREAAA